jgi:hypothetical protein
LYQAQKTSSSRSIDKLSDMIEINMGGLCSECIVLQARAEITDKNGQRLGLNDQVYTHHILAVDMSRGMNIAPIIPTDTSGYACAMGKLWETMLGTKPTAQNPKPNSMGMGHGHSRRSPQVAGAGLSTEWGVGLPGIFSIFIAKGNEADSSIFAVPSSSTPSQLKSGYWVGKNDTMLGIAEVVSYKEVPQDVYLSIDYNYIPMNGSRPKEYLDVGFGVIMTEQCGDLSLRMFIQ